MQNGFLVSLSRIDKSINKITNYYHFLSAKTGKSLIKGVVDTFALHEGQPGHHMQITIKNDLTTLPDFLRYDVGRNSVWGKKDNGKVMIMINPSFWQLWRIIHPGKLFFGGSIFKNISNKKNIPTGK